MLVVGVLHFWAPELNNGQMIALLQMPACVPACLVRIPCLESFRREFSMLTMKRCNAYSFSRNPRTCTDPPFHTLGATACKCMHVCAFGCDTHHPQFSYINSSISNVDHTSPQQNQHEARLFTSHRQTRALRDSFRLWARCHGTLTIWGSLEKTSQPPLSSGWVRCVKGGGVTASSRSESRHCPRQSFSALWSKAWQI